MTDIQIEHALKLLEKIVEQANHYTLTGAADWPLLVAIGGILIGLLAWMWAHLHATIQQHRDDLRTMLTELKQDGQQQARVLWKALEECQNQCCPRRHWDGMDRRERR